MGRSTVWHMHEHWERPPPRGGLNARTARRAPDPAPKMEHYVSILALSNHCCTHRFALCVQCDERPRPPAVKYLPAEKLCEIGCASNTPFRALYKNQKHRNAPASSIPPMTNRNTPMPNPRSNHAPHFPTQSIEELTPDNDPESWASFQRALSKWKAKCASQETASSPNLRSNTADESGAAAARFERLA